MINNRGSSIVELLGGLSIIVILALASSTISIQVTKASKKARAIALAIQLESALIEAVNNREQKGYTDDIRIALGNGTIPNEIELWSTFGTLQVGAVVSQNIFYKIKPEDQVPNLVFYNENGNGSAIPMTNWLVRLRASIGKISDTPPQYNIAYAIEPHPSYSAKPLSTTGTIPTDGARFAPSAFDFPIAQSAYSFEGDARERFGQCNVNDGDQIVGLRGIRLGNQSDTYCVVKGRQCASDEISVGIERVPPDGNLGHYYLHLVCKKIRKCGCIKHGATNWMVTGFKPAEMVKQGTGEIECGTCEYAFLKEVPGRPKEQGSVQDKIDTPICPASAEYVVSGNCTASPTALIKLKADSEYDPPSGSCLGVQPPDEPTNPISPSSSGRLGWGECSRGESTDNNCWSWKYNMTIDVSSTKCKLTGLNSIDKKAYVNDGTPPP